MKELDADLTIKLSEEYGHSIDGLLYYLDVLRQSSIVNMFEAGPFLQKEFGLSKRDAREVLMYWMDTFPFRHS